MTIVQKEWYTVEDCLANPRNLYIFGDNTKRYGKGGQATIRDCSNSFGVATKFTPSMSKDSFFTDSIECLEIIEEDLRELRELKKNYDNIVFPYDGLGTGLSDMPNKCPRLFKRFSRILEVHFEFNNKQSL
jgi:hypothetical protein